MTETLAHIATRFSCRKFSDTPITPERLRSIAEAGLRAPSAHNRQPWRFIVVADKEAIEHIDATGMALLKESDEAAHGRMMDRGGKLLYNAVAMIIIAAEKLDAPFPVAMDIGIAASTMTLAAASLGINSCIVGVPKIAFKSGELVDKYIPEGFEFGVGVLLGYAEEPGTPHEVDSTKITYM
ncbi:MAG: nitroreductase family protein [Propionibacteriaceae bacterium]|jgi:nitroreductase|nr:nitroreductase family protein [Propionibacteriaceae bacterium]